MDRAREYIQGVLSGNIPACKFTRLAVERQVRDLKIQQTKDFPYSFDEKAAQHVIEVFEKAFYFTKGQWRKGDNNKPRLFELQPWQVFILTTVFGWKHVGTGRRRFRDVYIKVPRKNGKTELMIGVAQYGFAFDSEADPEIYWFATKEKQAKIGWQRQHYLTTTMRTQSPPFAKYCDTSTYRIYTKEGLGFVDYLGQDSNTEDGPAPYYGICDEYHAHKTDGMVNVITSGMGSRESPMLWRITTAGTNKDAPCKKHEEFCENILTGRIRVDGVFCIMYGVDKDDNIDDQQTWRKANPAYDFSEILREYLHAEYDKSKKKGGTDWQNFKTKNLNIWSDVIADWIPIGKYKKHQTNYGPDDLRGRQCFGGLDLASVRDTNAFCLFFPSEKPKEPHRALWWYWLPKEEAKERGDKHNIDYEQWAADGWITLTSGDAVDYAQIAADITGVSMVQKKDGTIERIERPDCPMVMFNIDHINYDRKFAPDVIPRLMDEGLDMRPLGQGYFSLSAPTKQLEAMISDRPIDPDNPVLDPGVNPVSEWQFSNIVIEQDSAENIKITKNPRYQQRKIDGWAAFVNAVAGWLDWKGNKGKKGTIEIFSMGKRWHS